MVMKRVPLLRLPILILLSLRKTKTKNSNISLTYAQYFLHPLKPCNLWAKIIWGIILCRKVLLGNLFIFWVHLATRPFHHITLRELGEVWEKNLWIYNINLPRHAMFILIIEIQSRAWVGTPHFCAPNKRDSTSYRNLLTQHPPTRQIAFQDLMPAVISWGPVFVGQEMVNFPAPQKVSYKYPPTMMIVCGK